MGRTVEVKPTPGEKQKPDPHSGIITTAYELGIRRAEADGMNRLSLMTINGLDGGNTRRPILDISRGITCQEIVLVMRPGHTPKTRLMGRHDELKAEIDSIPQREFSLLVSGQ